MNFSDLTQRTVIATSPYPPFRWLYAAAYGLLLQRLKLRLRGISGIRTVELREPRKTHRFGVSDLDVRAETTELSGVEFFALLDRLSDVLRPDRRWMRILDFYIFGPAEAQIQRRLGALSFGESRWIPLLGSTGVDQSASPPATLPPNTALCRGMYEYGNLLQELFESRDDSHTTWTLYRRMMRIDSQFASAKRALDSESLKLRGAVIARADHIARGGWLRPIAPREREEMFALAVAEMHAIAEASPASRAQSPDSNFELTSENIPPANLRDATDSCAAAIRELCSSLSHLIQSAILGCVPASRFDYRLHLILRDYLTTHELGALFCAIRTLYRADDSYRRIPNAYLRLRHPMVLTPTMWYASLRWYHALRPVEECFFLKRHAVVLWGTDLRDRLGEVSGADVIRSAAIAVADLRNVVWEAHHGGTPRRLADCLLGRIPALWLLLARSMVASTSEEALKACARTGFPGVPILEDLHARIAALRPEKLPPPTDPVWQPAWEACPEWLDTIAGMALMRLESLSNEGGRDAAARRIA